MVSANIDVGVAAVADGSGVGGAGGAGGAGGGSSQCFRTTTSEQQLLPADQIPNQFYVRYFWWRQSTEQQLLNTGNLLPVN